MNRPPAGMGADVGGGHAVYFIGAGLTKALEREVRVPLMADFVSVLAEHVEDDVILTTLVALERAGLFRWQVPEARALVESFRDTKDWRPAARAHYRELLLRRPAENIEALLESAVEARSLHAELSPQRFVFAINRLFVRLGWRLRLDLLDSFLTSETRLGHARQTFVSFNYDLALERGLQRAGAWSPKGGYGFPISEYVKPEAAKAHMSQFAGQGGAFRPLETSTMPEGRSRQRQALVLKPHGSLNWLLPFSGNYAFEDAPVITVLNADGEIDYLPTFDVLSVLTRGALVPRDHAPFVVPPARKKNQLELRRKVLEAEREGVRQATSMCFVGWSMPETDRDQISLIEDSIARRREGVSELIVINRGAEVGYFERVARVVGVEPRRMIVFNAGLDDYLDRRAVLGKAPGCLLGWLGRWS